ncbi:platelet-activating factor acetylhydrolase IB subunit alpha1 [Hydra vulgaris]|uniref:Platelet-activating factor acetylhydrolase IB subunit alpha1 n=1 Tax=Hydra vulgaris TaxID=6087 RepID=A0ABM4DIZ7_HYDVU
MSKNGIKKTITLVSSPVNNFSSINHSSYDPLSFIEKRKKSNQSAGTNSFYCTNISPATTPSYRDNKAGWFETHNKHAALAVSSKSEVILIGDSIIAGLSRYHNVWRKYFNPLKALNFGIGGDRTQHVLWRAENLTLSQAIKYIVIHCGTNNLDHDNSQDIANGIISIGLVFQEFNPNIKIIVTGLLPRDSFSSSFRREKILQTNKRLKKLCKNKLNNFFYMKQDVDWTLEDGDLNVELYYSDCLHLVETGNNKLAISIVSILNKVRCEENIMYSSDDLESEFHTNFIKKRQFSKRRGSPLFFSANKRLRNQEFVYESRNSLAEETDSKSNKSLRKQYSVSKLTSAIKSKIHAAIVGRKNEDTKLTSVAKSIDISSLDDMKRKKARLLKFDI